MAFLEPGEGWTHRERTGPPNTSPSRGNVSPATCTQGRDGLEKGNPFDSLLALHHLTASVQTNQGARGKEVQVLRTGQRSMDTTSGLGGSVTRVTQQRVKASSPTSLVEDWGGSPWQVPDDLRSQSLSPKFGARGRKNRHGPDVCKPSAFPSGAGRAEQRNAVKWGRISVTVLSEFVKVNSFVGRKEGLHGQQLHTLCS